MEDNKSTNVKKTVKSGITFGSALPMEKQSHFCIIFWWTLLIRDSTLEMS